MNNFLYKFKLILRVDGFYIIDDFHYYFIVDNPLANKFIVMGVAESKDVNAKYRYNLNEDEFNLCVLYNFVSYHTRRGFNDFTDYNEYKKSRYIEDNYDFSKYNNSYNDNIIEILKINTNKKFRTIAFEGFINYIDNNIYSLHYYDNFKYKFDKNLQCLQHTYFSAEDFGLIPYKK